MTARETPADPVVAVVGGGLLHRAVLAALADAGGIDPRARTGPPRAPDGCAASVSVSDAWEDDDRHDRHQRRAAEAGIPWLAVWTEADRAFVGPPVLPGAPGCMRCLRMRRAHAREDWPTVRAVREWHGAALAAEPSPLLTGVAAALLGALAAERLLATLRPGGAAAHRPGLLAVGLTTLDVRTHAFLPDPCCAVCGGLAEDGPEAGRTRERALPKPEPRGYRMGRPDPVALGAALVDPEAGLLRGLGTVSAGVPLARAPLRLPDGQEHEAGLGSGFTWDEARSAALLEGAERYASVRPRARRTVVHAPYTQVREDAVDPRTLGLHPDARYGLPGFPFRRFEEDRAIPWVWGWSYGRNAPVLLPQTYVYFYSATAEAPSFVFEVSNGCALGGCQEEARLHGLLEVAERDAFFTAWHRRTPLDAIDPHSAADPTVPLLAEHIRLRTGHTVHLLDATLEQHIPCVVALAVDDQDRTGVPKAAVAAGAHSDPERAAARALGELAPHLALLMGRYPAEQDRARRLAEDPALIGHPADHALAAADPAAFPRLAFLLDGKPPRGFTDVHQGRVPLRPHADLGDDLRELVARYLDTGFDVLAVDQTPPELAGLGLSAAKVVVPGTVPVTYGALMRRTEGLPRLAGAPSTDPHPFP